LQYQKSCIWHYFVFKLLTKLQGYGEKYQHLIEPRNRAFCLVGVKLHGTMNIAQLVYCKDQLVTLDIEADCQVLRQTWS
jgi:hypothetical protein